MAFPERAGQLFMVELTELVAAHVAVALHRHVQDLRRQGMRPPPALLELLDRARAVAAGPPSAPAERPDLAGALAGQLRPAPLLVDRDEAARLLSVSPRQISRLVAAGELRTVGLGGAVRYAVAELEDLARRRALGVIPGQAAA